MKQPLACTWLAWLTCTVIVHVSPLSLPCSMHWNSQEQVSGNWPCIWLKLQDSQLIDLLQKIEPFIGVHIHQHAGLAIATGHKDHVDLLQKHNPCFLARASRLSWLVAVDSPTRWHAHTYKWLCFYWHDHHLWILQIYSNVWAISAPNFLMYTPYLHSEVSHIIVMV